MKAKARAKKLQLGDHGPEDVTERCEKLTLEAGDSYEREILAMLNNVLFPSNGAASDNRRKLYDWLRDNQANAPDNKPSTFRQRSLFQDH